MRYIIYYHDYFGNFNSLLNFLCSSDGKQQYINVSLIRYIHFFSVGLSCDIIVQSKAFITGFWF